MCGLVSSLSLHLSTSALCLQQQPTPSASEAHTSCLEAEKQIPFYLPCKSTDVQNVSKCTQTSLGFRHSISLDDLLGIFIPIAFQTDKLSFCSFTQNCLHPTLSTHVSWTAHLCSHFCFLQLLRPFVRQILY